MHEHLELKLTSHLTRGYLLEATQKLESELRGGGQRPLLVDCTEMDNYDNEARDEFVAWVRRVAPKLGKISIVTTNQLWHVVVGGISLATRTQMKPFAQRADALEWLAA